MMQPLRSLRITKVHHYYGLLRGCLFPLVLSPSWMLSSWLLPFAIAAYMLLRLLTAITSTTFSHVPHQSLDQIRATSTPDTDGSAIQVSFRLVPDQTTSPVLMSFEYEYRCVISGLLSLASLILT